MSWQISTPVCFTENMEWALNTDVFANIVHTFFLPERDLFAFALNYKVQKYVSWLPDPNAYAVDAFTITWKDLQFYAFPPFSILPPVLAKIVADHATCLLIIPKWTTQSWFPQVLNLLIQHPQEIAPCTHFTRNSPSW